MFELNDNNEWKTVTEAKVREAAKEVYSDVGAFVKTVKDLNGMSMKLKGNSKVRFTA